MARNTPAANFKRGLGFGSGSWAGRRMVGGPPRKIPVPRAAASVIQNDCVGRKRRDGLGTVE